MGKFFKTLNHVYLNSKIIECAPSNVNMWEFKEKIQENLLFFKKFILSSRIYYPKLCNLLY